MALALDLFGDKLRRYRELLQLTFGEISQATGIGEEALAVFERGEHAPTGDEILILTDFYKCDYKFFLSKRNEQLLSKLTRFYGCLYTLTRHTERMPATP